MKTKNILWSNLSKLIPEKVKITADCVYEILWVKKFKDNKQLGETRYDEKQIVMNVQQGCKETVHTYFHEYWHALSNEYDINLTENQVQKMEKATPYIIKMVKPFIKESIND
jgi:hypothetical protein